MRTPLIGVGTIRGAGPTAVLALLLAAPETLLGQCIMCRQALASPEGQQMIAAFQSGILFLLAAPFACFAVVAFLAVRRQRRRAADDLVDRGAISESSFVG